MEKWMLNSMFPSWMMISWRHWGITTKTCPTSFPSRTKTSSTPLNWPRTGSKPIRWRSSGCQHSPLISIQLSICGFMSNAGLPHMRNHQRGLMTFGFGCRVFGLLFQQRVCQRLVETMPRRIEAVINAKGWYTEY